MATQHLTEEDMVDKGEIDIAVDFMKPSHMDDVEKIENSCFEHPWTRKELESAHRKGYYLSKVAIITPPGSNIKIVVGSMFVEVDKFRYTILSLAVHEDWRRYGIGTAFLQYLVKKLRKDGRHEIYELVRETNLRAQKFYRAIGFVAGKPKRDAFSETDEDAYPMVFKWEWSPQGRETNGVPDVCVIRDHLCTYCGDCSSSPALT